MHPLSTHGDIYHVARIVFFGMRFYVFQYIFVCESSKDSVSTHWIQNSIGTILDIFEQCLNLCLKERN